MQTEQVTVRQLVYFFEFYERNNGLANKQLQ